MTNLNPNPAVTASGELITQAQMPATAITLPQEMVNENLPSYMLDDTSDDGTELMRNYIKPPRLAICQNMTKREVKEMVGPEGTVFLRPTNTIVAGPEQEFRFIPIFFYPEFIKWNPRGSKKLILDRSFDPLSEIAIRARSFDKNRIYEPCPEFPSETDNKKKISNQEHLNFLIVPIDAGDLCGTPVLMSFSKTGLQDGQSLINQIKIRKCKMWGLIFTARSAITRNEKSEEWFHFDIRTSLTEAGICEYAPPDWYEYCARLKDEAKQNYADGVLQATYEQEEEGEGESSPQQSAVPEGRF